MNPINKLRLKLAFKRLEGSLSRLDKNLNGEQLLDFVFSKQGSLITPWQFREEISQLVALYEKRKPKYALEIGTANGGTLFLHTRLAADNAQIISIDLPQGKFGGGYPEWKVPVYKKFAKPGQKIELIRASSHEQSTLDAVKKLLNGNKLNYLFIDGDHTYEGVKKDFILYKDFVEDGGMIVFHDIVVHGGSSCQVDKFWNEVKKDYKHVEFVKSADQGKFGIGVLYK